MSLSGAADPLYVAARRALLDALDAVSDHMDAVVLVGAQAIYLHTGEGDLAVAPFTTDGDLALDPSRLGRTPLLEEALTQAGFMREPAVVGIWQQAWTLPGPAAWSRWTSSSPLPSEVKGGEAHASPRTARPWPGRWWDSKGHLWTEAYRRSHPSKKVIGGLSF